MALIQVDQEKCVRCGICAQVCPVGTLAMGAAGPEAVGPEVCIDCGHCVAVCPQAALEHERLPLAGQEALTAFPAIGAEAAGQFLRSRRSVRCFRPEPVPRAELRRWLDMGRFAPTAGNQQGVSYILVEDAAVMRQAVAATIDWMEAQGSKPQRWSFPLHVRNYREKGIDSILRNAPHLLLATTATDAVRGRENTVFSLAYLELYATALGLGSCWAGLLEMCLFDHYEPLTGLFGVPAGREITGALMAGYPRYRYQRMVDRKPLEVLWR